MDINDIEIGDEIDFETFLISITKPIHCILALVEIIYDKMNEGDFFKNEICEQSKEIVSLNHAVKLCAKEISNFRDFCIENYDCQKDIATIKKTDD